MDADIARPASPGFLADRLLKARAEQCPGLIPFINCGDPDLTVTRSLLSVCERSGVCAVELGVPFAGSITDGATILRSHDRALRRQVEFEDVLDLVRDLRRQSVLPIFLLVEYGHTVRGRGIESVVSQAKNAGIDGMLMHCLPPMLLRQYLDAARSYELATVLGLFPNSSSNQIQFVLSETTGLIYLASAYGKTGVSFGLAPEALCFFRRIRQEADQPLAVGFGLKTRTDLNTIFDNGADAGIIGSPVTAIVEQHLDDSQAMCAAVEQYFKQLQA